MTLRERWRRRRWLRNRGRRRLWLRNDFEERAARRRLKCQGIELPPRGQLAAPLSQAPADGRVRPSDLTYWMCTKEHVGYVLDFKGKVQWVTPPNSRGMRPVALQRMWIAGTVYPFLTAAQVAPVAQMLRQVEMPPRVVEAFLTGSPSRIVNPVCGCDLPGNYGFLLGRGWPPPPPPPPVGRLLAAAWRLAGWIGYYRVRFGQFVSRLRRLGARLRR